MNYSNDVKTVAQAMRVARNCALMADNLEANRRGRGVRAGKTTVEQLRKDRDRFVRIARVLNRIERLQQVAHV